MQKFWPMRFKDPLEIYLALLVQTALEFMQLPIYFFLTVKTTEDATPTPQKSTETTQREQDRHSQPTIRTTPPRQGKRKKKSSAEKNIVTVDRTDNFPKVEDSIGAVVAGDSRRRNTVEPNEWSQSSATEAVVSQGQMELLLVVRYDWFLPFS